jgi:hypothetical protein
LLLSRSPSIFAIALAIVVDARTRNEMAKTPMRWTVKVLRLAFFSRLAALRAFTTLRRRSLSSCLVAFHSWFTLAILAKSLGPIHCTIRDEASPAR